MKRNLRVRLHRQDKPNNVVSLRCKRVSSNRLSTVARTVITATNVPVDMEAMDTYESK